MTTAIPATGRAPAGRARRRPRGLSPFLYLLGLALAAFGVALGIELYNRGQEGNNKAAAVQLLNQLRISVEAIYAGSPTYGNNANLIPTVDARGGIPDTARVRTAAVQAQGTQGQPGFVQGTPAATEIRHPFGGLVTIVGGPGGAVNQFRVTFEDLDNEVCAALADSYANRTRARAGIVDVVVNAATVQAPFTIAQITTACNAGAGGNDIGFTFG